MHSVRVFVGVFLYLVLRGNVANTLLFILLIFFCNVIGIGELRAMSGLLYDTAYVIGHDRFHFQMCQQFRRIVYSFFRFFHFDSLELYYNVCNFCFGHSELSWSRCYERTINISALSLPNQVLQAVFGYFEICVFVGDLRYHTVMSACSEWFQG